MPVIITGLRFALAPLQPLNNRLDQIQELIIYNDVTVAFDTPKKHLSKKVGFKVNYKTGILGGIEVILKR